MRIVRFIGRWAFRLIILMVVVATALLLLKDTLIKSLTESRLRAATGLEIRIQRMELGLFSPTMTIEGFRLYNPAEFGGSPFIDLPELHVQFDRKALANRTLHLQLVRLNLAEVHVVDNLAGQRNLDFFQEKLRASAPTNLPSSTLAFAGIDMLNLSVGKLKYTNLRRPDLGRDVNIGLKNEIVTNVKSTSDLSGLLLKIIWQSAKEWLSPSRDIPAPAATKTNQGRPRRAL